MGRSLLIRSGLSPSVALISYNIEREIHERQYVCRCKPRLPQVEKSSRFAAGGNNRMSNKKEGCLNPAFC